MSQIYHSFRVLELQNLGAELEVRVKEVRNRHFSHFLLLIKYRILDLEPEVKGSPELIQPITLSGQNRHLRPACYVPSL